MDIDILVSRTNECDGGYQCHQPLDIFIAEFAMLMFFICFTTADRKYSLPDTKYIWLLILSVYNFYLFSDSILKSGQPHINSELALMKFSYTKRFCCFRCICIS